MHERRIDEDWVKSTVHDPDMTEPREDDEIHYLKKIPQKRRKRGAGDYQSNYGS